MEKIQKKVAYLRGLAAGLDIERSDEGRVLKGMLSVLDDISSKMSSFQAQQNELETYVEAIDEDLSELEADMYEEFDEDDDDVDFYELDEDAYDDDEIGYFEVECPNCQEIVCIDQDIFDHDGVAEVLCPDCHEVILVSDDDVDFDDEAEWEELELDAEDKMDDPRVRL